MLEAKSCKHPTMFFAESRNGHLRTFEKHEQMQCGDQSQCVDVQGRFLFGLCTLITGGGTGACCLTITGIKANLLDEGTSLLMSQLALLCQIAD